MPKKRQLTLEGFEFGFLCESEPEFGNWSSQPFPAPIVQHLIPPLIAFFRFSRHLARTGTLVVLFACTERPEQPKATEANPPTAIEIKGHERMLAILADIKHRTAAEHPQLGTAKAEFLRRELEGLDPGASANQRCQLHATLGHEELKRDNLREGIRQLQLAREQLAEVRFSNETDRIMSTNGVLLQLGMAYMRLGETENCCQHYSAESCILPIQGAGVHSKQEGSRAAITVFTEILEAPRISNNPIDHIKTHLAAKWLLNLAYMTIGGFPDDVPSEFKIGSEAFESEIEFPRFRNVAPQLELDTFNLCGAAIVDDFDGDNDLDILTSSWDTTSPTKYFRNEADGSFTDASEQAGLLGLYGGLHMVQGDYDNDGDLDVFVFRGAWGGSSGRHPNSLLRNDGGGSFIDVTFMAGLGERHYPTQAGAWADYDNDGDLDLFVGNEATRDLLARCELFRNNGDGTFTDVAQQAGVDASLFAKGVCWGDIDGDRYPDLFISNAGGPNRLFHNKRDGTFTDIAEIAGVLDPKGSFPAWFWDYDNDGKLDLWVGVSSGSIGLLALFPKGLGVRAGDDATRRLQESVVIESMALFRGDGQGEFINMAQSAGLNYPAQPMGCNFGDLNNDGFLDFYLGTGDVAYTEIRPNVMFLNQGGEKFSNVTMAGGFGHLQKGHGVSFADIDNDGDSDVYAQLGGAYHGDRFHDALFENPGFPTSSITIQLQGTQSNRSAIGARIHVIVNENGTPRSIYRHVDSGSSFGSNPLRQTIGVGMAKQIERVEIFWPTTGETQVFKDVAVDRAVKIVEGNPTILPLVSKRFRF